MSYDPYNPYNPYPYNPPRPPQQNTYAFVSGLEGAKQYPIPVNQSMLLMDNAQPVCYLKQANAMGQATLKCFKLVEVSESDLTTPAQPKVEYATKSDIEALNSRIDALIPKEK